MRKLALIAALLSLFGWIYAYKIAVARLIDYRRTWVRVVIGDAITDLGSSAALYVLTRNWRAALIPWAAHALTGGPMILGQELKHYFRDESAALMREDNGNTTTPLGK